MDQKDKDSGKEKKKKKDKEDRLSRIKHLEKQLEDATHQIESLKIKLQNTIKDSLKLQQSYRRLQKLWLMGTGTTPSESSTDVAVELQTNVALSHAARGKLEQLKLMLEQGADIHQINYDGRTALHLAAVEGQFEVVEFLVKTGSPLFVRDRWGHSPLQEAILHNQLKIAMFLERAETLHHKKQLDKEYRLGAYIPLGAEPMHSDEILRVQAESQLARLITNSNSSIHSSTNSEIVKTTKSNILPPTTNKKTPKVDEPHTSSKQITPLLSLTKGNSLPRKLDMKLLSNIFGSSEPKVRSLSPPSGKAESVVIADDDSDKRPFKSDRTIPFGVAFNMLRGSCLVLECNCSYYSDTFGNNGPCHCGHYPASHCYLGLAESMYGIRAAEEMKLRVLVPKEPGKEWPKVLNQYVPPDDTYELSQLLKQERGEWEIDARELIFLAELGHGSSAVVYKGLYRGNVVAIKLIYLRIGNKMTPSDKMIRDLKEEFTIMSTVQSPYIIRFYGMVLYPRLGMVMEFCSKGSLYDFLNATSFSPPVSPPHTTTSNLLSSGLSSPPHTPHASFIESSGPFSPKHATSATTGPNITTTTIPIPTTVTTAATTATTTTIASMTTTSSVTATSTAVSITNSPATDATTHVFTEVSTTHSGSEMSANELSLDWPLLFKWFSQTVMGLSVLHNWKPPIVHRDIKTLNLLIDDAKNIKLTDFGLSRFVHRDDGSNSNLRKLRGTYAYCAPEVYFGEQYTPKADIYSLGIILWELVTRLVTGTYERPYSEYTYINFDFQIVIQAAKKGIRPSIPDGCPGPVSDLIKRLWSRQPEERPDCSQLLEIIKKLEHTYRENKSEWDRAIRTELTDGQTAGASEDESETVAALSQHKTKKSRRSKSFSKDPKNRRVISSPTSTLRTPLNKEKRSDKDSPKS
jgi:hypothetical protein